HRSQPTPFPYTTLFRSHERALVGELLDRIAAIPQDTLVTVDVADRAATRRRVEKPRIVRHQADVVGRRLDLPQVDGADGTVLDGDRKSTRLNSSHQIIS